MAMRLISDQYLSRGERASLMHGVPIALLIWVKAELSTVSNAPLHIRYRGPRRKTANGRTSYAGQLTCLKRDATHFSVYFRE